MQRYRFKTEMPAEGTAPRIDREARVIYGVQVLAVGEAKGHEMMIDEVMLKQAADLINAAGETGLKSRFTHPGMCADGMGKQLGRLRNGRVVGQQTVADLHFAEFASKSPEGDLSGYVLNVAEEDPATCGMSIVFSGVPVWKNAAGAETPSLKVGGHGEVERVPAPEDSVSQKPFARIAKLDAADVVDEPAATSGLLAAAFSATSNADAAQAFAMLDQLRESRGFSIEQAHSFLNRYFTARGFSPKERPMTITPDRMAELCEKHPAQAASIAKQFAAGKTEAEIIGAVEALEKSALSAQVEALTKQLGEAKQANADLQAKHDKLSALKAGTPEDPGTLPNGAASGDPVKAEWESMPAAKRLGYFDSFDVFAEAKRMEAADKASAPQA